MNKHNDSTALETLLRQAATDVNARRVLPQALRQAKVICFGQTVFDDEQRPWTQINGYPFGNELVLPCFLTEDALNRSITDDIACLTVLFSDFVRAALGHGVPVMIDPGLPHEYRIAPDALHHYQGGDGTLPYDPNEQKGSPKK